MQAIDTQYAHALVAMLSHINDATLSATTPEAAEALKDASKAIALRLKELTSIQGGEA